MKTNQLPPLRYLQQCFEVDAASFTGLRWKTRPREHFKTQRGHKISTTREAGHPAGWVGRSGDNTPMIGVKVNQQRFTASRIIFALVNKFDPGEREVDHIDGNPLNNHPKNLRIADRSQNASNKGISRVNTSGVIGVTWCKRTKKWMAQIGLLGRTLFLGRYHHISDAESARKEAEQVHHGEYSGRSSRPELTQPKQINL